MSMKKTEKVRAHGRAGTGGVRAHVREREVGAGARLSGDAPPLAKHAESASPSAEVSVWDEVIRDMGTTPERLDELSSRPELVGEIARHPNTTPETLGKIARYNAPRNAVARHPNTSAETLDLIARYSRDNDTRNAVARHPNTSRETVRRIAEQQIGGAGVATLRVVREHIEFQTADEEFSKERAEVQQISRAQVTSQLRPFEKYNLACDPSGDVPNWILETLAEDKIDAIATRAKASLSRRTA